MDVENVTIADLQKRCYERLPLYDEKAVKKIIAVFLEELGKAIIESPCVKLKGLFAIRHKQWNEKRMGGFGNTKVYPAHMGLKATFSKSCLLKEVEKHYKDTGKVRPGSLNDIPLNDFK